MRKRVSIVTTVRNEAAGCQVLLDSIADQVRQPDEVIVVDGGSTDGTLEVIREARSRDGRIKLIEAPGANIGRGRNVGVARAGGQVIASTDTGCRLDPHWLEELVKPFEDEREAEFVAGFYRIEPQTLTERVIGMTTMRGALDPVDPGTFNPSARSTAFTKELWERAGRIPDFLDIDDTLWDAKIRSMKVGWVFAGEAVVYWRPRGSFGRLARQFHFYGCGGGHTQIFAEGSLYNIRNLAMVLTASVAALWQPWVWLIVGALFFYFYVHAFHGKAVRVMRAIGDWRAYFLSLATNWTVILGDTSGYITGTIQRLVDPKRYREGVDEYLGNLPRFVPNPSARSKGPGPPALREGGAPTVPAPVGSE